MLTPQHRYQILSDQLSSVKLYSYTHFPPEITHAAFPQPWQSNLFLGHWSLEELSPLLNDFGFFNRWKIQGHTKIWVEISPESHKGLSELSVWTELNEHAELLMHLIVWLEFTQILETGEVFSTLSVEHLRLQNPTAQHPSEPYFPGQDFPRSGLIHQAYHLIRHFALILETEIITEIPEYFHTAYLFQPYFTFIDPKMRQLFEDVKKEYLPPNPTMKDVRELSQKFENGEILRNNVPYYWPTELQFFKKSS